MMNPLRRFVGVFRIDMNALTGNVFVYLMPEGI
jgi:hypothetical protein